MSEAKRRRVAGHTDIEPSATHHFNYHYSKPYLKNRHVLDIGCWTGQLESLILQSTRHIIGIDPGVNAIKAAQKRFPHLNFKVGIAEKLEFKNNLFDTVLFFDVIEHLPKGTEPQALSEIHRVLKPGGHLIMATPNAHPISILMDPAYFLIAHRHYSMNQLTKMLNKASLEIVNKNQNGGVLKLSYEIYHLLAKHILGAKTKAPKHVIDEYYKKGFAQNYLIAKKI
ncbi:hypothetical protein A2415_00360 [candidate division WWE3 bacterium RIFOXYC1_FULL_39_7]|uniref:Methyltransferase type 11 domain-containing protein n=1 Tax=candidate division WWE3 bacterium RIFOXYC1_FULL_39_7 TaxID=1802643 RepID=A0A1F4WI21_UNCKA|nr:MAG: hypothetical protein A2415_00360 [candidate division WWE3 bacterium RIFOXYC1_FULL_39_7]